jgi:hypothetical protein
MCTECGWRNLQRQPYLCSWVDLKAAYKRKYKRSDNLKNAVAVAGRQHCHQYGSRLQPRCCGQHTPGHKCGGSVHRGTFHSTLPSCWMQGGQMIQLSAGGQLQTSA